MSKYTDMVVITDLVTLSQFFEHAVITAEGFDGFHPISAGTDGIQELAALFEKEIKSGQQVCTFQVAETPLTDNKSGLTTATFACTLMIIRKMGTGAQKADAKLLARNETWLKALRLIGLIRSASEWYATTVAEVAGQSYEVVFNIFQDKLLPLGKIVNANTQGWLIDIDVTIPVNPLMYE